MTRGVEESHATAVSLDVVGPDMLGDATTLACCNLAAANVVEQRGLAVVDMTHDGDDRRSRDFLAIFPGFGNQFALDVLRLGRARLMAHFLGHKNGGFLVQRLVDGHHRTHVHQGLDQLARLDRHQLGQFTDGDRVRNLEFAPDRLGRHLEAMLTAAAGRLRALALGLAALALGCNVQFFPTVAGATVLGRLATTGAARFFFALTHLLGFARSFKSGRFGHDPRTHFGILARLFFGLAHLVFFGAATLQFDLLDFARFGHLLVALLLLGPALLLALALGRLGFLTRAA